MTGSARGRRTISSVHFRLATRLVAIALLLVLPAHAAKLRLAPHPPPFVADAAPPHDAFSAADLTQIRTTHLTLDLEVDFAHYLVRGSATESIVNLTGTRKFVVDTRNLDVQSVTIDGVPTTWSLGADSRMGRPLAIDIAPSTTVVRIDYATKSDQKSSTLNWLAPPATIGGIAPFLYTNGEPDFTRGWIPLQDTPGVRMTYSAHIRVPPGLLAVMSATNPTETSADGNYTFGMAHPIPPYLIALAVGRLQFHALGSRTGFYAEPEVVDDATWDMQSVPAMLDTAEHLLGPYPFDRYDVVLMPPSYLGGMENPQANFINMLNCVTGNHEPPAPSLVIAHELSHSWSGDMVTCATWSDTWLNEGFATYLSNRILDELSLPERAQLGYYFSRANFQGYTTSVTRPALTALHLTFANGDTPLASFSPTSYDKGSIFLKMIEDSIGRPAFDAYLHDYLDRNRLHWADDSPSWPPSATTPPPSTRSSSIPGSTAPAPFERYIAAARDDAGPRRRRGHRPRLRRDPRLARCRELDAVRARHLPLERHQHPPRAHGRGRRHVPHVVPQHDLDPLVPGRRLHALRPRPPDVRALPPPRRRQRRPRLPAPRHDLAGPRLRPPDLPTRPRSLPLDDAGQRRHDPELPGHGPSRRGMNLPSSRANARDLGGGRFRTMQATAHHPHTPGPSRSLGMTPFWRIVHAMALFDSLLAWLVSVVGIATGAAYIPQALRIWKRRSSDDVSILTYLLFLGGQLVYLVYGIRIRQWPLIVGMAANIAGSLAVIGSALRFRART